jgi:hypothetical protein
MIIIITIIIIMIIIIIIAIVMILFPFCWVDSSQHSLILCVCQHISSSQSGHSIPSWENEELNALISAADLLEVPGRSSPMTGNGNHTTYLYLFMVIWGVLYGMGFTTYRNHLGFWGVMP